MNTIFEQFESQLFPVFKHRFAEMLREANTAGNWDSVMQALTRHGVNATIVAAPFTRLGWERVSLQIDRSRLGDNTHIDEVSSFLSREWLKLLKRELKAGSVAVLVRIDGRTLLECMSTLYVNESTGDGVASFVMARVANAMVDDSDAVQAAFASLDARFETLARVTDRNASRAALALSQRVESQFDDLAEQTRRQFDIAGQLQEARFDLALSEAQLQQVNCAKCEPVSCATPEFAMPRQKGLYRSGHEKEDAWIYEQEQELAVTRRSCDCP